MRDGEPLMGFNVQGNVTITSGETWSDSLIIENCIIDSLSVVMVQFGKPVRFINCRFKKCEFSFAYFLGGLIIDRCVFDGYLDFEAGGHNQKRNLFMLKSNTFSQFVNFFDCQFNDEVIISENKFLKSTNLLGMPSNISVAFDITPTIENNYGRLDSDFEDV